MPNAVGTGAVSKGIMGWMIFAVVVLLGIAFLLFKFIIWDTYQFANETAAEAFSKMEDNSIMSGWLDVDLEGVSIDKLRIRSGTAEDALKATLDEARKNAEVSEGESTP